MISIEIGVVFFHLVQKLLYRYSLLMPIMHKTNGPLKILFNDRPYRLLHWLHTFDSSQLPNNDNSIVFEFSAGSRQM